MVWESSIGKGKGRMVVDDEEDEEEEVKREGMVSSTKGKERGEFRRFPPLSCF